MADQIRYDLLTQQALRGVVKTVLTDAYKKGLPGEHHFYISFDTQAGGVKLSQRLRAQYPEEMTIILQHQFWDLTVSDDGFEVGLSFGGIPERLSVPFDAIKGFFDPSVQFGLQFEETTDGGQDNASPASIESKTIGRKRRRLAPQKSVTPVPAVANPQQPVDAPLAEPPKPAGAEVVRLDRFRKK
ncbi:MAG: SspB family protein [Pseudolabrys sp.]